MEERLGLSQEVDETLVSDIALLVEENEQGMALNIVLDLHPADLATLLSKLPLEEARILFDWLPAGVNGDVYLELDYTFRAQLLQEMEREDIVEMVDEMDSDDAADVIAELPDELAESVLPELEDEAELRTLLSYEEESAGGLMATEFVSVPYTWTVEEATEEVRRKAEEVEPVYAVYVVNENNELVGIVSLKQLLLNPSKTVVKTIMQDEFVSIYPDADQEEVARIMERYDLTVLPVVDQDGKILGRITIDDVVDVIREEAEEDIQRMSGISADEELSDSVFQVMRGRLPWLYMGLSGSLVAGMVIENFTGSLNAVPILAMFIPIVASTAGNVGIQSSAIAVQGLASGDLWASDLSKRLFKELLVSFLNGLALNVGLCTVIATFIYFGIIGDASVMIGQLCLTVALALVSVIILAATVGTCVPILLHRLGIDPAIATGPFVTTSNDILGLLIYFAIAQVVYF